MKWIPVEEKTPENDARVLLSFCNSDTIISGRYTEDSGGGKFIMWSDGWRSCVSIGLYVNAWMPMPKPYREDEEE